MVELAKQFDLSVEHSMLVDDAFRRSRAAAGEDDGGLASGGVVGWWGGGVRGFADSLRQRISSGGSVRDQLGIRLSSPKPLSSADGDVELCVRKTVAIERSDGLYQRDRDK